MPGTLHLCCGNSEHILTAMEPLRIVLVDDHEMVLQGLTTILGRFLGRVRVVGQALDADAARKLAGTLHPDIILCDVRLRGSSGLDLCRKILERDPAAKVVLLSAYDDEQYLFQAMRVGAKGLPAEADHRRGPGPASGTGGRRRDRNRCGAGRAGGRVGRQDARR